MNMREVVGAITLQNLITDRDKFSDEIQSKAAKDMAKLGLEVISCNIQNITDKNTDKGGQSLIENLGADNTFAIRKNAAITKANAERDIEIAQQNAAKEANDVRVKTETEIAERNNELAIKKAELKIVADTKQADADAAYEIQKQEKQKTINTKTVDAQIEQTKREQTLSEEKIKIKENELKAQINAQADSEKYKTEIDAQAKLEQQKRDAEARAYLATQEAIAIKAKSDASRYEQEQRAEGIRAVGIAEADAIKAKLQAEAAGILAKGTSEAEAMEKKAQAFDKYGQAAILDLIVKMNEKVLPDVAKYVAEPLGKIGDIKIFGTTGKEASGVSGNVPIVVKQSMDLMKEATGVDMAEIVKANTITAKTDRNVKIEGESDASVVIK